MAFILSAWSWAAWCFQSFGQAFGSLANSGSRHSGVPSAVVGSMVQAVKSIPMPMTSSGFTREARMVARTLLRSAWSQSWGC